jgi:hypothetical protein
MDNIINNALKAFKLNQNDIDSIKTEEKKITVYLNRGNGCIWIYILKKAYNCVWQNSWHKERARLAKEAI